MGLDPITVAQAADKSVKLLSSKAIKETSELHLADLEIESMGEGLPKFPNLEVLWLNNNSLRRISGLEGNFRLSTLCCQNNKIGSLQGIGNLIALDTLLLSANEVEDVNRTTQQLAGCQILRQLDLSDNPVVNEENARLYLVYHLPQIQILNKHHVTDVERQQAEAAARAHGWGTYETSTGVRSKPRHVAFGRRCKQYRAPPRASGGDSSVLEKLMVRRAHNIMGVQRAAVRKVEVELSRAPRGMRDAPIASLAPPTEGLKEPDAAASFQEEMRRAMNILDCSYETNKGKLPGDVLTYHEQRAHVAPPQYSIRLPKRGGRPRHDPVQPQAGDFGATQMTDFGLSFPRVGPDFGLTQKNVSISVTSPKRR